MRVLLLAPFLMLAGCATDRQISDYVCTHQISVRLSAETALKAAASMKDPVARQTAIDTANTTLAQIDACPPSRRPRRSSGRPDSNTTGFLGMPQFPQVRAGVDHGIQGSARGWIQADRVEGVSGGFHADSRHDLVEAAILQGNPIDKGLRNRLDGEHLA